jgi:hypothetical protein
MGLLKRVATGVSLVAMFVLVAFVTFVYLSQPRAHAATAYPLGFTHEPRHACQSEDAQRTCYWDATRAGNGHGHSFNLYRRGHTVCVDYWQPRFAQRHNHCDHIG